MTAKILCNWKVILFSLFFVVFTSIISITLTSKIYVISFILFSILFSISIVLLLYKRYESVMVLLLALMFSTKLSDAVPIEYFTYTLTIESLAIFIFFLIYYFQERKILFDSFSFFSILLIVLAFISLQFNDSIDGFTILISGILAQLVLYQIITMKTTTYQQIQSIIQILILILGVVTLFTVLQVFINYGDIAYIFKVRFSSIFYNPVIYSVALVGLWPFLFLVKITKRFNLKYIVQVILLSFFLISLISTQSRGAFIIFILQLIYMTVIFKSHIFKYKILLSFIFIIIISTIWLNIDLLDFSTSSRLFNMTNFTAGTSEGQRLLAAQIGLHIGYNNLWTGVGLGNFNLAYNLTEYIHVSTENLSSAHNFLLNIFAELGILGALFWSSMIFSIIYKLIKLRNYLENHHILMYHVFIVSFLGITMYQILFYGEFIHINKFISFHMVIYFTIMSLISSFYNLYKGKFR
ncbi:MAG: hypothetical protein COB42_04150 [Sulfurimonas sp.]|nr:MAG: hypothetical protein COB42_04150 [Sulfurimonas sp.]